jgi:K(+)-stimulated pyrophosphate-energized sodium pump
MVLPGVMAIITPVLIGFFGGPEMLGGLLAGVTVTGVLMAIFQSNAGGAWDNAKKMVENGIEVEGEKFGKGSEAHKAAVVGDTVGDPFKDTSGPSLNILLKLMSVVALVIAPSIALNLDNAAAVTENTKKVEVMVNAETQDNGTTIKTTTTTTTTTVDGKETSSTEVSKEVIENTDNESETKTLSQES